MIVPEISTPTPPDPVHDIHPSSPPSSSASDSDAYNTESARLHFGPFKTPERKFVARSERLFPPPNHTASLRRSPRLSSPRLRLPSPTDLQAAEEREDMELVAQIVNDMEVDDDDLEEDEEEVSGSLTHAPGSRLVPDEPSSVLAEKISRAMDNPSPPPSPPPFLSIFDPYHTSNLASSNNRDQQFLILEARNVPQPEIDDPLSTLAEPERERPASPLPPAIFTRRQGDLISFSTPPPQHIGPPLSGRSSPLNSRKPHSVDDSLKSLETLKPSEPQQRTVPTVVVELESAHLSPMDTSMDFSPHPKPGEVTPEPKNLNNSDNCPSMAQLTVEDCAVTPLRRSPRPRRSVTPIQPSPVVVTAPPSNTRTQPKRKGRISIAEPEIVSDSQDEDSMEQPHLNTPSRSRQRSPGKAPLSFHRELGSLSPTSSSLLSKLGFTPDPEANEDTDINKPGAIAPMLSFSVFQTETVPIPPGTLALSESPVRFSSPSRNISPSPNKFKLHTPAANDPANTPARRIPIEQAISQGHLSPEKAIQLGFSPNGMPLSSVATPARRVLIAKPEASSSRTTKPLLKPTVLRFGSPTKGKGKERERSAEPVIRVFAGKGKAKAQEQAQEGRETNALPSPVMKPGQLPFPLVAAKNITPLVSDSEKSGNGNPINSISSPLKSDLKQTTSKIPRIGIKPYSRSTESKPVEKAKAATTLRMVDLSKPSSRKLPLLTPSAKAPLSHVRHASTSTARVVRPTISTASSDLKRKRELDKSSPIKPRMIRQVISKPVIALNPSGHILPPPDPPGKNVRVSQPPPRMRRVVDPEPTISNIPPPPPSQQTPFSSYTNDPPRTQTREPSSEPLILLPNFDDISPGSPMQQDPPSMASSPPPPPPNSRGPAPVSEPSALIPSPESALATENSRLRRTTRSRRTLIVEDAPEVTSRPSNSRRRTTVLRSDDVFSGMSTTALKDLTTSNTARNQRYLAAKLETEVIRREGVRPESPVVKIRTISQRQQEEQEKQRADRAKRRARRSEEMASSDIEASSQAGYSSPCEDQSSGGNEGYLPKHQRGPGDEDDYETPERSTRGLKRTRLFDTGEAEEYEQRRVKWDRGLFTTVYIDEVKLGTRQTLKENRDLKGILAPTAKALRLDTLGNLPQAESPLSELVQENVTVKKFVYDSDIPPVQEPVVKNTRSKSRKR